MMSQTKVEMRIVPFILHIALFDVTHISCLAFRLQLILKFLVTYPNPPWIVLVNLQRQVSFLSQVHSQTVRSPCVSLSVVAEAGAKSLPNMEQPVPYREHQSASESCDAFTYRQSNLTQSCHKLTLVTAPVSNYRSILLEYKLLVPRVAQEVHESASILYVFNLLCGYASTFHLFVSLKHINTLL